MHGPLAKYWGGRPPRIDAPDSTHLNPALKVTPVKPKTCWPETPFNRSVAISFHHFRKNALTSES